MHNDHDDLGLIDNIGEDGIAKSNKSKGDPEVETIEVVGSIDR